MAETLDIDLSAARRQLQGVQDDLKGIEQAAKSAKTATNNIVDDGSSARGYVEEIKRVQKEYADLQDAAKTLRVALERAYDPRAVEGYSKALAEAERGLKKYEQAAEAAGVALEKTGRQTGTAKDVVEGLFGSFTKAALIVEAIRVVKDFTTEAVNLARQVAKTEKQFAGFVGGVSNAKKVIADVNKAAAQLVLPEKQAQQAAKALLGFGLQAKDLPVALRQLADVARGSGKDFNDLAVIYGKARASGRLFAEDINQLQDAGIPIAAEFAKQLNVTTEDVRRLAEQGKIGFSDLQVAFANLTKEGGLYYKQAILGADAIDRFDVTLSKFKTNIGTLVLPILEVFVERLDRITQAANSLGTSKGIGDFAKKTLDFVVSLAPATDQILKYIERLTGRTAKAVEQQAQLIQGAQSVVDAADIDKAIAGEKEREKVILEVEKKLIEEAKRAAEERARLRIEGMVEGQAKELAQEEARFKTLVAALKKYHLDTEGAEQQHAKNVAAIKLRFYLEDLMAAKEARDAEAESIKRGFEELEKLEGDAANQRKAALKAQLDTLSQSAAFEEELFKTGLLSAKERFFSRKRSDKEIDQYEKDVAKARAIFELEQQRRQLEGQLLFDKTLTENERQTLEFRLANIKTAIDQAQRGLGDGAGGKKKPFSFLSLLGIDPDTDEGKKAAQQIQDIVGTSISALNDLQAAREAEAQAAVDAADRKVDAAQEALDAELRIAELGFASNVELKQREVEQAKAQQEDALRKQAAVQKRQAQIETAQQAVSLITTAANIIKQWSSLSPIGWVLGIAQIGAMFAAFAAARAKARATVTARHGASGSVGEDGVIVGPSHEGGGVPLEVEGREFFATNGQQFGVVNRKMTDKHFDLLQAINRDDRAAMVEHLEQLTQPKFGLKTEAFGVSDSSSAPNGSSEGGSGEGAALLKKIERNTAQKEYVAGNYRIIKRGNQTRRIRLNG